VANPRWAELPKDKLIVLYCWDTWCSLATSAALVLLEHGYRLKELYCGIAAWQTFRMPVEELWPQENGQVGRSADRVSVRTN